MKKSILFAICALALALASCSDDDKPPYRPEDNYRTVASADELIGAMHDGVDIYVPEGKVIDMTGKPAPKVDKDVEVCIDGEVKNLSGYVNINKKLTLTGKGRLALTGTGGLYINAGGELDAENLTIDFTAPQFQIYGCTIYVNGGNVSLKHLTVTSTNQCVFSSQVFGGSQLKAENCKFLSTATQYNCCYAIEAPGPIISVYEDCQICGFYGGVITESPKAHVELSGTTCAVYMPSNTSYTCQYAVAADAGSVLRINNDCALYGEGKYVAAENNRLGSKGTLQISSAHVFDKPFNIPDGKTVEPADGQSWTSSNDEYTFYYPDGSTRKYRMQWCTSPL